MFSNEYETTAMLQPAFLDTFLEVVNLNNQAITSLHDSFMHVWEENYLPLDLSANALAF